jgi:hypothetical protein
MSCDVTVLGLAWAESRKPSKLASSSPIYTVVEVSGQTFLSLPLSYVG